MSRRHYPKQLIRLFGEHSLLQETLLRCTGMMSDVQVLPPLIVCNEAYRFIVAEQAADINVATQPLLLEPVGRNTAPALTVAAQMQLEWGEDPILLMLPADHIIKNASAFYQALNTGVGLATGKFIVAFGIQPTRAATGYGYIKHGRKIPTSGPTCAFQLTDFIEKPGKTQADEHIRSRKYLWNSGIYMVQASGWLSLVNELQPEIYQACITACKTGKTDGGVFRLAEQPLYGMPKQFG